MEQVQAQVVAQALVVELARLRVLVQAAVLELAQVQAQRLVPEPVLELVLGLLLERELPVVRVLLQEPELELALGLELVQEPLQVLEPARQQELAVEPERVRELRVSRQLELQQHRLLAAAQELPPYLPALPMKAPC